MKFTPEDFLKFAFRIYSDHDLRGSAGVRTAISRCYYSALLTARLLLKESGVTIKDDGDVHAAVVDTLMSDKYNAACRKLCDDLNTMNVLRIKADLNLDSNPGEHEFAQAHSMAQVFNRDANRQLRS